MPSPSIGSLRLLPRLKEHCCRGILRSTDISAGMRERSVRRRGEGSIYFAERLSATPVTRVSISQTNNSIPWDRNITGPIPTSGCFNITKRQGDKGKFKTPTLREIANTGPYMHDGRFKTLEEVVDFYGRGGIEGGRCAPVGIGGSSLGLPLPYRARFRRYFNRGCPRASLPLQPR